ncbi:hypothetical protein IMAU60211_01627 [Lactobacillus helveticus]|nr:hypothetical protein [Lactobacillus helveticus]NRO57330.1 hypothetical protein [Lactobacillus helveticus]NRO72191.1 hypothetical protein [Lactobacillus helveticus]
MKFLRLNQKCIIIYANKTEDFDTLRAFALTPVNGSVYDLRDENVFQKQFDFINQNKEEMA